MKTKIVKSKSKKEPDLYHELLNAREVERQAAKYRIELEEKIFESVKSRLKKTEGQETIEDGDYSITVNQPMNYKLDAEKYRALAESLPEPVQFHRVKLEIDKTKYKNILELADQRLLSKIHDCVSATPGKVSIAVNIKEVE
jgi:hypothetical protein